MLPVFKVANTFRKAWFYWNDRTDCWNKILEGILFFKQCYKSQNKYEGHLPDVKTGRITRNPWLA